MPLALGREEGAEMPLPLGREEGADAVASVVAEEATFPSLALSGVCLSTQPLVYCTPGKCAMLALGSRIPLRCFRETVATRRARTVETE